MVTLQVKEGLPTVWLYVYSGKALLARVPYAPGLRPVETVELPDDSIRLRVEGELDLATSTTKDAPSSSKAFARELAKAPLPPVISAFFPENSTFLDWEVGVRSETMRWVPR